MQLILIGILFAILAFLSFRDVFYRTIDNSVLIVLLVISLLTSVYMGHWLSLAASPISFILISLCLHQVFGGGDIKLFSVLIPLITPGHWLAYLLLTLLFGGVLALFYSLMRSREWIKKHGLPYGVSISLSGFISILASL
ncbi:prepilin peptidase [Vibrio sp. SCSIO 43136]|uniref:prepilin peptidase n=1 Tax=Vibrio sp. SCSIO 43136 TaxID=2819101 RepID=UPI002184812F|nr:prepilin peptidase [Vibrio sp. SCSIO 43136]